MNFWQPLLRFVTETDVDVVMVAGRWTLADRSAAPFLARARALGSAYRRHGVELPHAAMRFALRRPAVAGVVVGMRTGAHARFDIGWATGPLPEHLWQELDAS